MWAIRIAHEASLHDTTNGNSFITLTYNDQHLPKNWSLNIEHFQKFMKRLRKSKSGQKIKYYHCGEYGNKCAHGINLSKQKCPLCTTGRPHYHAILLNCSFNDTEHYATQQSTPRYTSPELEQLWGKGFVDVGTVTMQSAAYVARYIMKKITGVNAADHYIKIDYQGEITPITPEYSSMSNGIGKQFYETYKSDFFPSDEVPVLGEGVHKKVPRYYTDRLRKQDEELYEQIKEERQNFMLENQHEYTTERLHQKYRVKQAQFKQLERNLD